MNMDSDRQYARLVRISKEIVESVSEKTRIALIARQKLWLDSVVPEVACRPGMPDADSALCVLLPARTREELSSALLALSRQSIRDMMHVLALPLFAVEDLSSLLARHGAPLSMTTCPLPSSLSEGKALTLGLGLCRRLLSETTALMHVPAGAALAPDACESLYRALREHPQAALVYGCNDSAGSALYLPWEASMVPDEANPCMWRTWAHERLGWFLDSSTAEGSGTSSFFRRICARFPTVALRSAQGIFSCRSVPERERPVSSAAKVSIIIPVWNQLHYTQQCLEALARTTRDHDVEIVVVDNASTDGTGEWLATQSHIRVLSNSENVGFTLASNQGAAMATGSYVLFLNNDTIPLPGWLEPLIQVLDNERWVGAVGSRLIYPDGTLQEAGAVVHRDGRGFNFGRHDDPSRPQYMAFCEVDYCTGACLMVRKDAFDRLGGFDARYAPAYYEETDLCFALRKMGLAVVCEPASTVVHFGSTTAGLDPSQGMRRYLEVNRQKFRAKWAKQLERHEPFPKPGEQVISCDRTLLGRRVAPAPARENRLAIPKTQPDPAGICWISDFLPRHDASSSGLRVHELVQIMASLNFALDFLYFAETSRDAVYKDGLGPNVRCSFMPLSAEAFIQRLLALNPAQVWLTNLWTVEYAAMATKLASFVRKFMPKTRIIVDTMDFHAKKHKRAFAVSRNPQDLHTAQAFLETEKLLYPQAHTVVAVSDAEAADIRRAIPDCPDITVIPNIVPIAAAVPPLAGRKHCVFLGNYSVQHNRDAVAWFLAEVFPKIRTQLPDMEFHLVGAEAERHYSGALLHGVVVQGFAANLEETLGRYRIFVCPMPYGAGMKGKIGSAFSCGLPVVTTSIGAEGFNIRNGEDAFIADDPAGFTRACIALAQDDELWRSLSIAGQSLLTTLSGREDAAKTVAGMVAGNAV